MIKDIPNGYTYTAINSLITLLTSGSEGGGDAMHRLTDTTQEELTP